MFAKIPQNLVISPMTPYVTPLSDSVLLPRLTPGEASPSFLQWLVRTDMGVCYNGLSLILL